MPRTSVPAEGNRSVLSINREAVTPNGKVYLRPPQPDDVARVRTISGYSHQVIYTGQVNDYAAARILADWEIEQRWTLVIENENITSCPQQLRLFILKSAGRGLALRTLGYCGFRDVTGGNIARGAMRMANMFFDIDQAEPEAETYAQAALKLLLDIGMRYPSVSQTRAPFGLGLDQIKIEVYENQTVLYNIVTGYLGLSPEGAEREPSEASFGMKFY